jgi:hypothetical protein
MKVEEFRVTLKQAEPPKELTAPQSALWWDAKGDWARAHGMIDDLSTREAMAVHAYLHRKEGVEWNAEYWYNRAGKKFHRPTLEAEWEALVEGLLESREQADKGPRQRTGSSQ